MLYTELVIGLFKVILYGLFIIIMVRIYTLPLFAVRPMYLTARAFKKAFNDVILSRRAIHNMNTWYPDATPEELESTDNVCIICREEMVDPSTTKKLPCNHIFHKNCLRSWFQRQQTCPTCRLDVLRAPLPGQQPVRRITPRAQQPPAQQAQQAGGAGVGGAQQQPQANQVNQMFAQLMAANARLQFPPGPPPQPTVPTTSSNGQTSSTTTATSTSTATTNSTAAGAQSSGSFPPPPFPPPFFMPPFSIPPPLPPQNFAGLTDDELKAMEGHERANVEARIKCLRNIQVLLDAAVMEMQQYSSVVSQLDMTSLRRSENRTTSNSAVATAPVVSPGVSSSPSSQQEQPPSPLVAPSETGARPKVKSETSNDTASASSHCDHPGEANGTTDEQDEVRKRRLERFGAAQLE